MCSVSSGLTAAIFDHLRFSEIVERNVILKRSADIYSDSPGCFHRVSPPKESMKVFLENRRLLISIRVLAQSAIRLAWTVLCRSCTLRWPFEVTSHTFVG